MKYYFAVEDGSVYLGIERPEYEYDDETHNTYGNWLLYGAYKEDGTYASTDTGFDVMKYDFENDKTELLMVNDYYKKFSSLTHKTEKVDTLKKEIKEMSKQASDKPSDLKQIIGKLEDKEQTKETQIQKE